MKFDESKVRTKWSDELDGKKGWFSDNINSVGEGNLHYYVEYNDVRFYGICTKGNAICPFKDDDNINWKYFYPEEDIVGFMEFDKKNLFIAGYNDNLPNIGDTGYTGDSVSDCVSKLTGCWTQHILTGCTKNGFITDADIYQHQFFYCTKCALKTKYVPWTKETFPLKCGDVVQFKDSDQQIMIVSQNKNEMELWLGSVNVCAIDFDALFKYYELPDGTPCGQKVQND